MSLPTLLLIDDDGEFIKAQSAAFEPHYNIIAAESVNSALQILKNSEVDCVLVDYFLGDGTGHDIASWIVANLPWCPVILISAKLDKNIAVESFAHRVFDILEKPFSLESALSKVQAAIVESKKIKSARKGSSEAWSLDRERRIFRCGADVVMLTSTEVKILDVLILATNQVVTRDKLVQSIWGSMYVADNTLDTHLTNLRKKAPFFKTMIKGVRGVGYVFEP